MFWAESFRHWDDAEGMGYRVKPLMSVKKQNITTDDTDCTDSYE